MRNPFPEGVALSITLIEQGGILSMRELTGKTKHFIYVYVILMGFFHLYTAIFGSFEAFLQRAIHLSWVLPLGFLLYPATGN